jgi:hypothetical protein
MKRLLLLCLILAAFGTNAQTSVYVDSSVSASGAGTAWASAYKTLSEALAVVNAASTTTKYEVHVAKGTYYPTGAQTSTKRDTSFMVYRGGVKVLGGYPNGGGTRNAVSYPVVLSGNINNVTSNSDNSYHIMVVTGISSGADSIVLDGFVFFQGHAGIPGTKSFNGQTISNENGAGLCAQAVANGKFIINNCSFLSNYANSQGGGLYSYSCAPTIIGCTFSNNIAQSSGGGAYIYRSSLNGNGTVISNCDFSTNTSVGGSGGGLNDQSLQSQPSLVKYCSFSGNIASVTGGGMYGYTQLSSSSSGTYLHKCTFTNNRVTSLGGSGGGGYIGANNYGYRLDSCSFVNGKANVAGGGLMSQFGASSTSATPPIISNSSFTGDSAMWGGGLQFPSWGEVNNCVFTANKADRGAGLICKDGSTLSISLRNNTFLGNKANEWGGGMYLTRVLKNCKVSGCLFSGNRALIGGGGLCDSNASPLIVNCTFSGDSAHDGNGINNRDFSSPTVTNCIIWEGAINSIDNGSNTDSVSYSIVEGGWPGIGVISYNPLFVNPLPRSAAPTTGGNYRITGCSPAIEGGFGNSYLGTVDIDGNPRSYGVQVDIGAYEFQGAGLLPAIGGSNAPVCVGSTVQLSNSTSGGNWSISDTSIATITISGLVRGKSAGVFVVSYTVVSGPCAGGSVVRVVTISAPAVDPITGSSGICLGAPETLASSTSGGVWTHTNTSVATINSAGVVNGLIAGIDTIKYIVTNSFGCSTTVVRPITVGYCVDSVWPGDVNRDKIVDNIDALDMALVMNSQGPTRSAKSIAWSAVRCVDWSNTLAGKSNVNRKNADCDGDGAVTYGDVTAITTNYGFTHPKQVPHTAAQKTAGLPDLRYDFSGVLPIAGTQITVPVKLGSATSPMVNMGGLAARMMIDWVLPSDTPMIYYTGSWFDAIYSMKFRKVLGRGRTDWTYARTDQRSKTGYDTLALVTFTIPPGTQGQKMLFYFDDVVIVDSSGQVSTQYNVLDDTVTILDPAGVSGNNALRAGVQVWPNPSANDECNVSANFPAEGSYKIVVSDMSGRMLTQTYGMGKAGMNNINLSTAGLSTGVYLISLYWDGQAYAPVRWVKTK